MTMAIHSSRDKRVLFRTSKKCLTTILGARSSTDCRQFEVTEQQKLHSKSNGLRTEKLGCFINEMKIVNRKYIVPVLYVAIHFT